MIDNLAFECGMLEERVRTLRDLVLRLVDACEQKGVDVRLVAEAKRTYVGTDLANISIRIAEREK